MRPQRQLQGIPQKIIGFHVDKELDWVAELACGHHQHVRRNPPWTNRHWVTTAHGRLEHVGHELNCFACPAIGALRLARVRQLFEERSSKERSEVGIFMFLGWLEENRPDLLAPERRDRYQHLKMDLEGLYKRWT